jgi:hypothetical protein
LEGKFERYREDFGESPECGPAANFLSVFPQNSVLLTFLITEARARKFSED